MKGVIINFRGSHKTKYFSHMIIHIENFSKEQAKKLVGKNVVWKSPAGKEIKGVISSAHGRNGAVRAIFEKGLPGQSLGEKVEIKN